MPGRGLEKSGALLRGAVEIAVDRQPGLGRRGDEGGGKRIGMAEIGDRQRATDAMKIIRPALLVFGLLEVGQDVVKTPALVAVLAPAIVILVLAANIKKAVDRTRTTEHLAARLEYASSVEFWLRLGLVHPVDSFFLEQPAIAERHVNPEVSVFRTCLEQQHRILSIGAQAI